MVTAYPVARKAKAYEICEAFIQGCGGSIATAPAKLANGAAFFYGVDESNLGVWREVTSNPAKEWYYCDNAYFDSTRQSYFRVTRNRLQHSGYGESTGARFQQLNIPVSPWSESNTGGHIIICPQSDSFMRYVVGFNGSWQDEVVGALRTITDKEVRVRQWQRDKGALAATLHEDLKDAYALVTYSSAAAVTAVLAGVPIVCSAQCAAMPMSGSLFRLTQLPRKPRETWAGVLADNQWTLDEFRSGVAWRMMHG